MVLYLFSLLFWEIHFLQVRKFSFCWLILALYLGHTTFHRIGAGSMYMLLQAVMLFVMTTFGLVQATLVFMPFEAFAPLITILGYDMVTLAFLNDDDAPARGSGPCRSPRRYIFAVAVGCAPALANLTTQATTAVLSVSGVSLSDCIERLQTEQSFYLIGAIALSQGFLLSSILFSVTVIFWTDRRYFQCYKR